ncbi:hypothetical protein B0A49_05858 [Cryomyces minteri]|uniref:Anaphase-promoting complex subunit 4 WD40 domain-containing protein n=1 Tax=Cryomyces minteri TaxID=331657 RepID=A0A4V5NHD8_9PEZI|nr:hypothetical protein B0A49_05858 [Cryomyces minteri]
MSAHETHHQNPGDEEDDAMFDPAEAEEEIPEDEDAHMDSDEEEAEADPSATMEEIQLENDSVAHFDAHKDSIFCIAQHPIHPEIVATGGGDDCGYIFDSTPPDRPVLPSSYQSSPQPVERQSLPALHKLEGHTDSLNAITFTLPKGEYLASAGLDGKLRVWHDPSGSGRQWSFLAEAAEVDEINWLIPCPHPAYPNTVALGANDNSVWVYTINAADASSPLTIVQAFYLHTGPCTAGAWTPDGKLLATVSEDSSLYVWDVFGEAAAAGLASAQTGSPSVVALTDADERFKVEGGLFSVAVAPNGTFAAVGGAEGHIRIVGLPRLDSSPSTSTPSSKKGAGSKSKAGGGKQAGVTAAGSGQAGALLASFQAQADSVETLAFSPPPLTLLAAGSVDGTIALFDSAHRFAVRRHIRDAHDEEAVIKVEFVRSQGAGGWLLTSCGNDGVVRRWDTRGGTAAAAQGLAGEWKGHRGGGEGGGVMGFVQGGGQYVVTAGDE